MEATEWICSNCGTKNTAKFCTSCGTQRPASKNSTVWICSGCGQENAGRFCEKCGQEKSMTEGFCTARGESRPNGLTPQDIENREGGMVAPVSSAGSESHESRIAKRGASDKKVKMYRMIAIAGICVAIFAGGFSIFGSENENGNNGNNVSTSQKETATVVSKEAESESRGRSTENSSLKSNSSERRSTSNSSQLADTVQQTNNKPFDPTPVPAPTGMHWISDAQGVYLWNPEPSEGETITWNGGYVTDGGYKYADGKGIVTWYRDGEIIQVDEGGFSHGRHHGKFVHKFSSGKVIYSNWDHGREIE